MKRLGTISVGAALAIALLHGSATAAHAQVMAYPMSPYAYSAPVYGGWGGVYPGFGYGGFGYGGLGYGGFGYGGFGYGGLGYGGFGYGGVGYGYGGYGYGYGYPAYGYGYPGYAYAGYGYGGYPMVPPGLFNPLFGVGLTPLGVQSEITERYVLGRGQLVDRTPATSTGAQSTNVRQFDYYRSR